MPHHQEAPTAGSLGAMSVEAMHSGALDCGCTCQYVHSKHASGKRVLPHHFTDTSLKAWVMAHKPALVGAAA